MKNEIIIVHNDGAQQNIRTHLDDLDTIHAVFPVNGTDEVRVMYTDGREETFYEAEIDEVFLGGSDE
jgi:hypothetical protein